jgi:hypothetical protein
MMKLAWGNHRARARSLTIVNQRTHVILARRADVATSFFQRLRGLIGRPFMAPGEGMVFPAHGGLAQVHTLFMRFPIDVLYADSASRITALDVGVRPWRVGRLVSNCAWVIELPAGTIAASGTRSGDALSLEWNSPCGR